VTVTASTGETCGPVALSGGAGSCNLTFNTIGTRTLTATYSPQLGSNFLPSSSSAEPHTVEPAKGVPATGPLGLGLSALGLGLLAAWRMRRKP
jgi:hypothetical protein